MNLVIKCDRRRYLLCRLLLKFDLPFSKKSWFFQDCIQAILSGKFMQRHEGEDSHQHARKSRILWHSFTLRLNSTEPWPKSA